MKNISTIIFDLDGTLVDSSEGIVEAVNYSLRAVGAEEQPPQQITPYIGYPLSVMYPEFTNHPVDLLYHYFCEAAQETVVNSAVALDGANECLFQCHELGFNMGIASTKISDHIIKIIDRLGWKSYFETTVGGDEVNNVKPASDSFVMALERLKVAPGKAVAVGDTVNDLLAAREVPMKMVAVKSPYGSPEKLRSLKPEFYIEKLDSLPDILSKTICR